MDSIKVFFFESGLCDPFGCRRLPRSRCLRESFDNFDNGENSCCLAVGHPLLYSHLMVATVLTDEHERSTTYVLRPEPLPDGAECEQRVVFCGISWKNYLAFDQQLGDDRPGPRLYYLDGEVELMTTSKEQERLKEWIGDLLSDYFLETGTEIMPHGQATM